MLTRTKFIQRTIPRKHNHRFKHNGVTSRPPIIRIENGTFYLHHPSSGGSNSKPIFEGLNFTLPSFSKEPLHWAILGPSATQFLQILRGEHICIPPTSRSYPYLNSKEIEEKDINLRLPSRAIRYVGFGNDNGSICGHGTAGTYLSARYESRRESTDFSVLDYLRGNTELNAMKDDDSQMDERTLNRVIKDLRLEELVHMPVLNLSNGQMRRAKIARALLSKPEILLLDEPFMGLDPHTLMTLSPLLHRLAVANSPRLILTLRAQDPIPDWTTHLMVLRKNNTVAMEGPKREVVNFLRDYVMWGRFDENMPYHSLQEIGKSLTSRGVVGFDESKKALLGNSNSTGDEKTSMALSRDGYPLKNTKEQIVGEPVIEMEGVRVVYGEKIVLGNWEETTPQEKRSGLWWTVRRGERWGIFGPNGSGKTTLLSLICSDHPQTYSLPIKLFGRSRLPSPGQPGISIFDLQARIGHSSPEIHNHFPKKLTVRQTLENAWSETFMGRPDLDEDAANKVDACLRWFEPELKFTSTKTSSPSADNEESSTSWADNVCLRELPMRAQRVALFIRALIKSPDLVILDEAFSGMNEAVRDKCMLFLAHGETKTISDKKGVVVDSGAENPRVKGLQDHQALICISHLPEEVPGSVRDWICLEEAGTGKKARVGRLGGPLEGGEYGRWNEIWGVGG